MSSGSEGYSLAELIERLSQSMQEHEDRVIGRSVFANLTITQIHYLDAIRHFDSPPTVSELARRMDITKPTATAAMERLEHGGFIRKVPSSEDRRVWYVHLTDKGLKISDLHDQIHEGYAKHFEAALSAGELDAFVSLLGKVIYHLGLR